MRTATTQPTSVPIACARKGKMKCFAESKGMDAARDSWVEKSAPSGGGITKGPILMIPVLVNPPISAPATTARKFKRVLFMGKV